MSKIDEPREEIVSCPICLQDEADYISNCKHHFCGECIAKCLRDNSDCPLCRTTLTDLKLRSFGEQKRSQSARVINVRHGRQTMEVLVPTRVTSSELYELLGSRFYLSSKHMKIGGKRLNALHLNLDVSQCTITE